MVHYGASASVPGEGEATAAPPAWQTGTPPGGVILLGYSDMPSRSHKPPELYVWIGQTFQSLLGWYDSGVSHWIATSHGVSDKPMPQEEGLLDEGHEATSNNHRRMAEKAAARRHRRQLNPNAQDGRGGG